MDSDRVEVAAREAVEAADKAAAPPGDAGQGWCDIASAPAEMHAMAWLWNDGWVAPMVGERLYDDWYLVTHDGDLAKDSGGEPIILDPTHWQPLSSDRVRESAARPLGGDMSMTRERPMRERLARIICAAFHDEAWNQEAPGRSDYIEKWWNSHLPMVYAILAEMRELDAAVLDHLFGERELKPQNDGMDEKRREHWRIDMHNRDDFVDWWRAAIDAIRDEGKTGITPRS